MRGRHDERSTEARRASVARRVARFGRHCACTQCGLRQQRRLSKGPGQGKGMRLRQLACYGCGKVGGLKAWSWWMENPQRAEAVLRENLEHERTVARARGFA